MKKQGLAVTIIMAWLAAGTLDILSAVIFLSKGNAAATFKYISGAVMGDVSLWKESSIWIFGAGFHYLIALCWTVFYFLIYKTVKLYKLHFIVSALLYGIFVFFIMQYVLVPLLGKPPLPKPITTDKLWTIGKNILILAFAFGVTLKLFARNYFGK
jgi:hypothetical protein